MLSEYSKNEFIVEGVRGKYVLAVASFYAWIRVYILIKAKLAYAKKLAPVDQAAFGGCHFFAPLSVQQPPFQPAAVLLHGVLILKPLFKGTHKTTSVSGIAVFQVNSMGAGYNMNFGCR